MAGWEDSGHHFVSRGSRLWGSAHKLPLMAAEGSGNDGLSSKAMVDDGGYPRSWIYTR
jgi:hypothetical protein